jgi:hypothetical protein
MMWRLNFLVLFCCLALNNSYMLYYICPMHTLFTLMVYGGEWGLLLKLDFGLIKSDLISKANNAASPGSRARLPRRPPPCTPQPLKSILMPFT